MRFMWMAAALVASALPAQAMAPGLEMFEHEVIVLSSGSNGGEWIAMLPAISSDCSMKVDKAQLQNVEVRFPDQLHTSVVAQNMANGFPNPFKMNWDILFKDDSTVACNIANAMWGEDGSQFPGVLRKM